MKRRYLMEAPPAKWPSLKSAREVWCVLLDRMGADQKVRLDMGGLRAVTGEDRTAIYKGLVELEGIGWIKRVAPRAWTYVWVNPSVVHLETNHDRIGQLVEDYENHGTESTA